MTHLEANAGILAERQPELAAALLSVEHARVVVSDSASGLPTARYRLPGGRLIALHSQYDPLREARQIVSRADLDGADYFVLLGFGLGYTLDALRENPHDAAARYFVVEYDLEILRAAFESRDLSHLLRIPGLRFAWPAAEPALSTQWEMFFDPVRARKSVFIRHPPSLGIHPEPLKAAADGIQSKTFQIFTDINTLIGRSGVFLDNFVQNLHRAIAAPGVAGLAGCFSGTPCVIVSAGPSLDRNIHELRHGEDRILIVATDTALKPLLRAGIEPHFIVTADPSRENYLHIQGARTGSAILVGEATAHPACFEDYAGRTVFCTFENSSLGSLSDLAGPKGSLRVWGSVATMALDFALLLGCDPVIFAGQDLAHTEGRTYCSGLYFEDQWFRNVHDPEDWAQAWASLRRGKNLVTMEDIFGRPIETTDKLVAYWNWITGEINRHPEVRFINATEGGILKEGVAILSLREALFRFAGSDPDLRGRVREAFYGALKRRSSAPPEALRQILGECDTVDRLLAESVRLCADATIPAPAVRTRLEAMKGQIYGLRRTARILDCFNQIGNVNFLRRESAAGADEIRDVYRSWFESMRAALIRLRSALERIGSVAGVTA